MKSDLTLLKAIGFMILGYLTKLNGERILSILFFIVVIIFMGFFVMEWLSELKEFRERIKK